MTRVIKKSRKCLICHEKNLTLYLSLGKSALANSYISQAEIKKPEIIAPLKVYYCNNCYLSQMLDIVDRKLLFDEYSYFSSTSPQLVRHFEEFAKEIFSLFPYQAKKLTVDIGSNDGILIKPLKQKGARVLGIDPAKNIADIANLEGIETIPEYFRAVLVPSIVNKYGKAGIITANNVLAHTDTIHDIIRGIKQLLDKNGVFIFEVQYIADLLKRNEFDNTYHEHICYYSLHPLIHLLRRYEMEIFDVKHVSTHGGSLRIYASHTPLLFSVTNAFGEFLKKEQALGLDKINVYKRFAKNPPIVRKKLKTLLLKLRKQGKKIVGYGAPAKAVTLLQYCKIGRKTIEYITDSAPSKQNHYMPGSYIPIVSPDKLRQKTPDYILIFAWNYASSIMKKERWFKKQGGKFIIPIPKPRII